MKQRVLVIDDDRLILYALNKAFKNSAYQLKTAATATAAIDNLLTCCYDLCLLDLGLLDFNGVKLTKIIRNISPQTRIVIMTAYCLGDHELDQNLIKDLQGGLCHFISKPFDIRTLTRIMNQVLTIRDTFPAPFQHTTDNSEKKRKIHRKPYYKNIQFQTTVIYEGENRRFSQEANTMDISGDGIGLTTPYPLKTSQVIGFGKDMESRTGVVIWSSMIGSGRCRAGIQFG